VRGAGRWKIIVRKTAKRGREPHFFQKNATTKMVLQVRKSRPVTIVELRKI
jgi:hypothetical protein